VYSLFVWGGGYFNACRAYQMLAQF
jgi:hypothetical protein